VSSLLSANQRQWSSNRANIPRTCWAKLSGPEYIFVAVRWLSPTILAKQTFAQLRTGLTGTEGMATLAGCTAWHYTTTTTTTTNHNHHLQPCASYYLLVAAVWCIFVFMFTLPLQSSQILSSATPTFTYEWNKEVFGLKTFINESMQTHNNRRVWGASNEQTI